MPLKTQLQILQESVVEKNDDYSISVTISPPVPDPEVKIHQRSDLEIKISDLRAKKSAQMALFDEEIAQIQALLDLCDQKGVIVKPAEVFVPPVIDPDVIIPDFN